MEVIISQTSSKGIGKKKNEDFVGKCKEYYWIMDGATVPTKLATKVNEEASWYVRAIDKSLIQTIKKNPDISLQELTSKVIQHVSSKMEIDDLREILPCATIVIIKIEKSRIKYLVLGDSALIYNDSRSYLHVKDDRLDSVAIDLRKKLLETLESTKSFSTEKYQNLLTELVLTERRHINKPGGFWVLSDSIEAVTEGLFGEIEKIGDKYKLLLITDGFSRIVDTYHEYPSFEQLVKSLNHENLPEVIIKIRKIEKLDKNGERYPRISSSDDATAVLITNY